MFPDDSLCIYIRAFASDKRKKLQLMMLFVYALFCLVVDVYPLALTC